VQVADIVRYSPIIGWGNPVQEGRLLVAEGAIKAAAEGDPSSKESKPDLQELQRWLEDAMWGKSMQYSPKGQLFDFDFKWGSLRIGALYAHVAFRAAEIIDGAEENNPANVRSLTLCSPTNSLDRSRLIYRPPTRVLVPQTV
jgi:hypothetical protein